MLWYEVFLILIGEKENLLVYLFIYSFSYFIYSRVLLSVAYLTVANLARLGISVQC